MEPREIPQETRRRLLEEAWRKGLKPRDLNVSYSFMYKMRKGSKPIPDYVVVRILEFLSDDDIIRVAPELAPKLGIEKIDELTLGRLIRLNIEYAKANPASARILLNTLAKELDRLGFLDEPVRVTEDHLREWEALLEFRVEAGELTRKTAADYDRELRRAIDSLGFLLSPQRVRSYIRGLERESRKRAVYASVALRLFASEILQDWQLRAAVPTVRYRPPRRREAPSWEDLCKLARALEWPPAKAYLLLLMSTGSRPTALRVLSLERLDLGRRTVWFRRVEEWYQLEETTKRQYVGFFTEAVRGYLEAVYLPWRDAYLEALGRASKRLFPVKRQRLYEYIYRRSEETLGYRIDLYTVRHRFISHILPRLPKLGVEFLAGHAAPSVALSYYAQDSVREDLRSQYDRAMQNVPCLSSRGE